MAHLHILQANWCKCRSLLDGFNTQHSLENNQFPKMMTRASDVLSNHKLDKTWKEKLKKKKDKEKEKKTNWNDDNDTNNANNNKEQDQDKIDASLRQQGEEIACCVCGEPGHLATKCSKWDTTPKNKWWSMKFKQFAQTEKDETIEATAVAKEAPTQESQRTNKKQAWCGLQMN